MAAAAKFRFDLDLGSPTQTPSEPTVSESALTGMLQDARMAGHAAGFTDGEESTKARAAQQLANAAAMLGDRVAALTASLDDTRRANLADAVAVAAAIGKKLAGALIERNPVGEIEALIVDCLASLDGVPHLVIRCHPDLADAVREVASQRMATSGFTGRLVVLGEPEQALGDVRLEWVDGGLVRDFAAIEREIDNRIAAFLAARGAVPVNQDHFMETDQ